MRHFPCRALLLALAICASALACAHSAPGFRPRRPVFIAGGNRISSADCQELWFNQTLDHFTYDNAKQFKQRYFVYDKYWNQPRNDAKGPIFFYAGNEANVELYVNATGLIWENAAEFKALVVFAEHRYYGQSQPLGPHSWRVNPRYLTSEQALADYAVLLWDLRSRLQAHGSPVIAFGGSYGGMLAAWLRRKYPHLVEGAVAASAPVAAFPGVPGFRPARFWEIVTQDATAAGGSAPECAGNVRAAFSELLALGRNGAGRAQLRASFRLCDTLAGPDDVTNLAYWIQGAFDAFAMGSYPYKSTYISGDPDHPLPAWPMRAACAHLAGPRPEQAQLLAGLREAAALLYNISGDASCFKLESAGPAAGNSGPWDYQWCTELMGQELPYYPATGVEDMFWDQGPMDMAVITAHCQEAWGVTPRVHWSVVQWGGGDWSGTSNVVFSNGLLDPWSFAGVLRSASPGILAVLIPDGGHHVDLMWSHTDDTYAIKAARQLELAHIARWVASFKQRRLGSFKVTV